MPLPLDDRLIDVFTTCPRTLDPARYWSDIDTTIDWSERCGCTGTLIFCGNDTYVDPWLVAQTIASRTRLRPLVAVNPIFMHPFSAAKMVSSLAYRYGCGVDLNLVAGAAVSYQASLGDHATHDARYERLHEYTMIVQSLLTRSGLTRFSGRYYEVSDLQLLPAVPVALRPRYFMAGQSATAGRVREAVGATGVAMLPGRLDELPSDVRGVHFGIITRPSSDEATAAADRLFPSSIEGRSMVALSMRNTDSNWKQQLHQQAGAMGQAFDPGYSLQPFRDGYVDCPVVIGDYARVAEVVIGLASRGVTTLILDIPPLADEFRHVDAAFALARRTSSLRLATRSTPPSAP